MSGNRDDLPKIDLDFIDSQLMEPIDFAQSSLDDLLDPRKHFREEFIKSMKLNLMSKEEALQKVLEVYPRIHNMITMMWGDIALHQKLTRMLYLDTNGREGFDKPVGMAIARLQEIHMEEFGFDPISPEDDPFDKKDRW